MFTIPPSNPTPTSRIGGHLTHAQFHALPAVERMTHARLGGTIAPPIPPASSSRPIGPGEISREVYNSLSSGARYEALYVRKLVIVG